MEGELPRKQIEARKGSRASHKEGGYGVFAPLLLNEQASEGGEPSCLHLQV